MKNLLSYLCLQATQEGQASHAHVHEIIKGLEARDWTVNLVEPKYAQQKELPGAFARLLEFFRIQIRLFLSPRPRALYIRWHFGTFPSAFLARMMRVPVIQEVNGPYEDLFVAWPWTKRLSRVFKFLMRKQLQWANAVITVTPQLAAWAKKEANNPQVFVVPNGANIELFSPDTTTNFQLPENFVVFFGALAAWQGIETTLQALNDHQWPPEVKLVVMGDGVERPKVEAAAHSGKVIYLGKVAYSEVAGVVAKSCAALSPKTSTGGRSDTGLSPLKLYETLACGVPIIVTDFPGMADLVHDNDCGLVIPPSNPAELAKAVHTLFADPELRARLGKNGRRIVEEGHSWDSRAASTDRVIKKVALPSKDSIW